MHGLGSHCAVLSVLEGGLYRLYLSERSQVNSSTREKYMKAVVGD